MRNDGDKRKEYQLEKAEAIKKQTYEGLIASQFEAMSLEKRIELFRSKKKPVSKSGFPQELMVNVRMGDGTIKPTQASKHLDDLKERIETIEIELGAIDALISQINRDG